MTIRIVARRGFGSALWLLVLGCALAACAPRVEGPAPVVGGAAPVERGPQTITVQRGQTLSEIAHSYHVPMRVIAEANGLSPPYHIQVGRTLLIPGAGPPRLAAAPPLIAALPPAQRPEVLQPTTRPEPRPRPRLRPVRSRAPCRARPPSRRDPRSRGPWLRPPHCMRPNQPPKHRRPQFLPRHPERSPRSRIRVEPRPPRLAAPARSCGPFAAIFSQTMVQNRTVLTMTASTSPRRAVRRCKP